MSTTSASTENSDSPARRATAVSPQELDYRLRGLILDPGGYVPTAPVQPERQRRRPRPVGPLLAKTAAFLIAAALACWLLQAFVAQPFLVPGKAMAPTLQAGDRILVVKAGLLESPVRAGQVVVIRPPRFLPCTVSGSGTAAALVLRVVALPGQTIWSVGDTIFVNGQPLREAGWYSPRSGPVGSRPIASTTLGEDQYFVLGDNRSSACDSRAFGPVAKSSIVGEAVAAVARDHHLYLHKLPA
ncbi:MAG TPA: signal peptidase I [Trebonia sp.]|jgi:signal peptidase I|nr:signal peptidase I [Trebonia sp.]